ncbi:uncharacterized protein LOC141630065 [Silene latifolia]|uniref:uncharacterized protein LOC141630065 n=1 Tax=Silene latifolia TaxID=37657 RepID=UPI003D778BE7
MADKKELAIESKLIHEHVLHLSNHNKRSFSIALTKLQDSGSFSISFTIGVTRFEKVLCDLGASVSVMPYSACAKLGMGELKCTSITLQMADRSKKQPLRDLEDIPVRVGNFFISVDFVSVDMVEDAHIPIILGRPILHTAGAVIDVKTKCSPWR